MDTTTSGEKILDCLKQSVLEYSLKHRIEPLVSGLACNSKSRFSSYEINPVRFELYNMYLMVQNCQYDRFDTIVNFLHELYLIAPTLIPEKLYDRVMATVKSLHIYECLRAGDLKKSSTLIKEYFPISSTHNFNSQALSDKSNKTLDNAKHTLELKILKLRTQWNELILNKNKRESFFKHQFHIQFDQEFVAYLLAKVNEIINITNARLPPTKIEQIIQSNFKDLNYILFGMQQIQLELEDDVRLELFMDNLHLHHHESNPDESIKFSKYLRKILKMLIEWEASLYSSESNDTSILQTYPSEFKSVYVHDMLYSQMDGTQNQYNGVNHTEMLTEFTDHEDNETKELSNQESSSNTTNCQTKLLGSITEDNSTTHSAVSTTNNNSTEFETAVSNLKDSIEQPVVNTISELITDDEKDD